MTQSKKRYRVVDIFDLKITDMRTNKVLFTIDKLPPDPFDTPRVEDIRMGPFRDERKYDVYGNKRNV